jgi:hypothetical protein
VSTVPAPACSAGAVAMLRGAMGYLSLPLDVRVCRDIPAAIRRAVILRDQHCRWAGGYFLEAHYASSRTSAGRGGPDGRGLLTRAVPESYGRRGGR